jgi:hypothetical protein
MFLHRLLDSFIDREIEFARESCRPQHANRVLTQARIGIANQYKTSAFDICGTADIVPDAEIGDI